ncbi:MAG: hypothetical protein J0H82_26105 [Alphaproteobacteria bacterium]|nr:hypothetical protein [Alphaproteobacteria bacterium]
MKPRRNEVDLAGMAVADMLRGEASAPSTLARRGRGEAWGRSYFAQLGLLLRAGCPKETAEDMAATWTDRAYRVPA